MKKLNSIIMILISTSVLLSCGSGAKEGASEDELTTVTEEETEPTEPAADGVIQLVVNSDDQMRYDTNELRVKAGATVELTLNHTGQMDKAVMGHNLVILKPGTDVTTFAQSAMAAKDNDYIPDGDEMVAYTALIGGGESTSITFTAPAAGTYDFICTFPGHYALMKGKFIVE